MPPRTVITDPGSASAPYTAALARLGGAGLARLRARLRQCLREADVADIPSPAAPEWEVGPVPLVFTAAEWRPLEAALKQRARLINALLIDLYGQQEALRQKALPAEIVFRDPYFRRPAVGLDPGRTNPATLLRFDLVKTADGWHFGDTHVNTPIGLAFALQNRRFLTQEAGELYGTLPDYRRINDFPLRLLDALQALAPGDASSGSGAPAIVMLTPGPGDPVYFEHSFLARKMGVPLAQGGDLLVVDNRVYFKTIAGLEPVDVIYRRLNDAHIDPVVFTTPAEVWGIPGLLQCVRHGRVTVANAIGAGLAENRALHAFLPRLMRFYLAEAPLLPSVTTYYGGDPDVVDLLLDHKEHLFVRPAHGPTPGMPRPEPDRPLTRGRGSVRRLQRTPHAFVVQPAVRPEPLLPAPGRRRPAPVRLCAYVLCSGRRITVLPGGLTVAADDVPSPEVIGLTADTVVLTEPGVRSRRAGSDAADPPVVSPTRHLVPGSRAAESLFWLGRYLERAESSARMLSILEEVGLEEIPRAERLRWLPLWQGVLDATGHAGEDGRTRVPLPTAFPAGRVWQMALDDTHDSSIISAVGRARENAGRTRHYVSPEAWAFLVRLDGRLQMLRGRRRARPEPDDARLRSWTLDCAETALAGINGFLAVADRTMLHDAGWQFLRIGLHLERAIVTCSALRHALDTALDADPDEDEPAGGSRESPALSALLRMLGSQDAYRRLYQSQARPRLVSDLFLHQTEAPRSVAHCLTELQSAFAAVSAVHATATEPADATTRLLAWLHRAPVDADTPTPAGVFDKVLERLLRLAQTVGDHFFSHQASLPGPDVRQVELPLDAG